MDQELLIIELLSSGEPIYKRAKRQREKIESRRFCF